MEGVAGIRGGIGGTASSCSQLSLHGRHNRGGGVVVPPLLRAAHPPQLAASCQLHLKASGETIWTWHLTPLTA